MKVFLSIMSEKQWTPFYLDLDPCVSILLDLFELDILLIKLMKYGIASDGVQKLLENLNPNKSMRPDQIHPRVSKQLATAIYSGLTQASIRGIAQMQSLPFR